MRIKAALFDLDGTLFDTEGQYTVFWERVGQEFRPDIPDIARQIKGTTLRQTFDRFFPDAEVQREVQRQLDEWEAQMSYVFYPGAVEFLRHLRAAGVRIALVTSSIMPKMRSVYAAVPGFVELFDRILTSEDFAASKPDPDCYLRAAEAVGCALDECVVFEDAFSGLKAGMAAGIFTFGMATTNSRTTIEGLCDCVLDGFEGLTIERITCERLSARGRGRR